MKKFIPLSVPNLKGNELKYVADAIEKEWVSTGGAYINKFEKYLAGYVGSNDAVACQSGTAGLHLSLLLSGVDSNSEVIVPTLTFIAAVNPVRYVGAEPIFMDCDDSLNMDMEKLYEFCENECEFVDGRLINKRSNKYIRAIVIVHVFGNIADMQKIMLLAKTFNLKVIEDATEALGSKFNSGVYKGKFAGTIGDFGVYSFNGNKIITTGGGGMLVARDIKDLKKARYLSTQAKDDELFYIHNEVGFNYRMTNLQAAVGLAQIEMLDEFINVKKKNYELYKKLIKDIKGLELLDFKEDIDANYWFYSLIIDEEEFGMGRDTLLKCLEEENIQTRPIWGLISEQLPYIKSERYKITNAPKLIKKILNIPCSSNLKEEDVYRVVDVIKNLQVKVR